MKKLLLSLTILLSFTSVCHAQFEVKVDERFELTSIVFALAGVPEYCQNAIPLYDQDVLYLDSLYTYTEPINFIRELNQIHHIGYNAVSSTACLLEIKDGVVQLQPQYNLSDAPKEDPRWTEELFAQYIEELNVFYKMSNFGQFFEDHRELYELAEQRTEKHIAGIATEWIESFFGQPFDPNIKIYICLNNGPSNYAMPEGVLLGVMADEEGLPAPLLGQTLPVLIHEILHHYTNPLILPYRKEMEDAAGVIYPKIKEAMFKIGYSNAGIVMGEWLNDLFVLMYLKDTGDEWFMLNVFLKMTRGFTWMQRSVDFMDNFYANRDIYPTIEDFMPQLVSFLNFTADNFDFVEREYQNSRPYIVSVYPAPGSDITDVEDVIITFSEPMLVRHWGFNGMPEGTELLWIDECGWDNEYQFRIKLRPNARERGHTYGAKLVPTAFRSAKYFLLDEKCADLIFKPDYQ